MQVTVLGSGVCASGLPRIPDRQPPGFWVTWDGGHLLFDASEGIRFRLQRIGVPYASVQHIAITHSHADHYALPPLLLAMFCTPLWGGVKPELLDLYAPDAIVDSWPTLFKIHVPEAPAPNDHCTEDGFLWPKLLWHRMSGTKTVGIGNAKLDAADVFHGFGRCPALAFRLETPEGAVVYSGDTGDCDGIRNITKHADLFISEASGMVGHREAAKRYGHLTPYDAGDIARASGVKKLLLTHYPGLDSNKRMVEDCRKSGFKGKIIIAKDFQRIQI
ncbi:MAG: ribonuclease Z [Parcubacteria group bacterium Gr01-1014_31]|nr:MAG: ribonuclease Z [Parcubacteria group bacterium Gr01-1014_31]